MYLVLGIGVSSKAVIERLEELNKEIILVVNEDEANEAINYCQNVITYEMIKYLDIDKFRYAIKSPGIPYYNKYIRYLRSKHIHVINEIELTYLLTKRVGTYIGVSGSVGKSSIVSLLYQLVKAKRDNVILAGNIGVPLITYMDKINKDTIIILEISSFQLDDFEKMRLHIALLTNIYDNHLDFYKNKEIYYKSKFKLTNNQRKSDYFLLNLDNYITKKYLITHYFKSGLIDYKSGFDVINNSLYYYKIKMLSLNNYHLKGEHNLDNLKAVVTILNLLNLDISENALNNFRTLKYHLEETVRNGVTIVNDSKSTSTSSLNQAIKTYNKNNLILLVGGYNKNLDFSFLNKYKFKSLICFGRLSKEIESILKADFFFDNLKEAAEKAFNMAVNDDIVLFSPGCASFDEFDSYLKRGEAFESYIREHYDK